MRLFCAVGLVALVFMAVGCGESNETTSSETTPREEPVETEPVAAEGAAWAGLRSAAGGQADRLVIPSGPVPEKVLVRRLHPGHGPALEEYDVFNANWVYFDYETGKKKQDSDSSPREDLTYSPGYILRAWWPGLHGMRVGERRELIVPSNWAYETNSRVYLVELVAIKGRNEP
jgi:FKBP-type peptidyl-prolyl cis-trans isomerase